jgi:pimeloyl-ACP methyl ester carboxylesterase
VGDPVILVAGSYSTYRAWNRIVPLLAGHYRLLALDYVGAGDSDKPQKGFRYSVQEQARLISKLIKQLNLGCVHLIGASYGGAIALNLAARHPGLVSKVVSIEGGIVKPQTLPGSPLEFALQYPVIGDLFIGLVKTGALNGLLSKLIAGPWYTHMTADDKSELLEQLRYNAKSASRIAWYWITVSHKTCEDFIATAKTMQMPLLYLYGTASDFMEPLLQENIRFLETHLPHARIVGLMGGIHDLQFQKPSEVADLFLDFLGEQTDCTPNATLQRTSDVDR